MKNGTWTTAGSVMVDAGAGVSLNYRLEGETNAPVVMLCHGLLGSLHMWEPQMRALLRRHRVLRWDNRGHGRSGVGTAPYSVAMLARDTLALMDALAIERAHFVGCSLGGMIAQLMAVQHAGRLASVVLVGTLEVMPPASLWDERVRIARGEGVEPLVPVMLERWFTPAFRASRPEPVEAIARGIRATPVEGFVGTCLAIKAMDQSALLARIRTPTLVMGGDQDPGVPVERSIAIHRAIAGSQLRIVEGTRHLFCIERARLFNRLLLEWLARH